MTWWTPQIPPSIPTCYAKEKPVLYNQHGHLITLKLPFGFANHPAVRPRN